MSSKWLAVVVILSLLRSNCTAYRTKAFQEPGPFSSRLARQRYHQPRQRLLPRLSDIMAWRLDANVDVAATVEVGDTSSDKTKATYFGLRLNALQKSGTGRADRCKLTLYPKPPRFAHTPNHDRVSQWKRALSSASPELYVLEPEQHASFDEFIHVAESDQFFTDINNAIYLQSMGLLIDEGTPWFWNKTEAWDMERHAKYFTADANRISIHGDDQVVVLERGACVECESDSAWEFLSKVLKDRFEWCKVFHSSELVARDPDCNSRVFGKRSNCQGRANIHLSQSSLRMEFSKSKSLQVLGEDVTAFVLDSSPDCVFPELDGSRPVCWQLQISDGRALTLIGQQDLLKRNIERIETVSKTLAGVETHGKHCLPKGGNTCLKAPLATCIEIPENPCPAGHGCKCKEVDMSMLAAAWLLEHGSKLATNTAMTGGNIVAGLLLTFHPPKFAVLPGPETFLIGGLFQTIKNKGQLPKCGCYPLECGMDAYGNCRMQSFAGVIAHNPLYCLPDEGWKCQANNNDKSGWLPLQKSSPCVLSKCSEEDGFKVGATGYDIFNCQPKEANASSDQIARRSAERAKGLKELRCLGV